MTVISSVSAISNISNVHPQKLHSFELYFVRSYFFQEFTCIFHGLLYFVSVPSMSLLLVIYSLGNLHVVSWGTREAAKPAAPAVKNVKKQSTVQKWMTKLTGGLETEDVTSTSSLIRYILLSNAAA